MDKITQSGIIVPEGVEVAIKKPELSFGSRDGEWLVAGPNEDFLYKIYNAFQLKDCHFVRYGTEVNHKRYKRIIVFSVQMPKNRQKDLVDWVNYLYSRLEIGMANKENLVII